MRVAVFLSALVVAATFSGEAAAAKSSYNSSSTITYNGATYAYSSTSTCADGTAALRYQRKWWCPKTTTTASASTTTSTSTSTTDTTSTSTSTSTGSTSTTDSSATTSTAPSSYNAQLSWTIPTTRTDGSALSVSDLVGYEVYYTNDSGTVSVVVPVSGGSTTATMVSSLNSGNYSFAVSAIDASGLKSSLSSVVAVVFP